MNKHALDGLGPIVATGKIALAKNKKRICGERLLY
jgi:hypothetical protein